MDCNNIHDQLSLLSSIPNFHWWQYIRCDGKKSSSDICMNLTDHFLYHPNCEESDTFKLKYIPKSPRNRLMYYIHTDPLYAHSMKRLIHQLLKLDKKEDTPFPNSPDNNSHFSHDCPPKKRRKYSTRIQYFLETRFWHDLFHSFTHTGGKCFKSSRICGLVGVNSEICEQFNSYLQCIKYTGSHLSQFHFIFFVQFFIYLWNCEKTTRYENIINVAIAGTQ